MSDKKQDEDFICTEYINYANQCKKQCAMCRHIEMSSSKKWIDIEDEGEEVN